MKTHTQFISLIYLSHPQNCCSSVSLCIVFKPEKNLSTCLFVQKCNFLNVLLTSDVAKGLRRSTRAQSSAAAAASSASATPPSPPPRPAPPAPPPPSTSSAVPQGASSSRSRYD